MEAARAKLALPRIVPDPGPPAFVPEVKTEPTPEAVAADAAPAVEAAASAEVVAEASAEPTAGTEPAAG
jgi:hypothetical protein